ncbi:MAG: hypothetical protein HY561_04070 [Gemmatimonadetes bacterium]|nr:hypothetical protein [Gemmatimonadota bacterium]
MNRDPAVSVVDVGKTSAKADAAAEAIQVVVASAHGAAGALVDEEQLALPVMD